MIDRKERRLKSVLSLPNVLFFSYMFVHTFAYPPLPSGDLRADAYEMGIYFGSALIPIVCVIAYNSIRGNAEQMLGALVGLTSIFLFFDLVMIYADSPLIGKSSSSLAGDIAVTYALREPQPVNVDPNSDDAVFANLWNRYSPNPVTKFLSVDIHNKSAYYVTEIGLVCSFYDSRKNRIANEYQVVLAANSDEQAGQYRASIAPGNKETWEAPLYSGFTNAYAASCALASARGSR